MGDERLTKSLDEIIEDQQKQPGNRKPMTSLNVRGSTNGRNQRQAVPYANSAPRQSEKKNSSINHEQVCIKFLLTHHMAGSLIGNGGQSIKELMEITGASVHVSSSNEHYPGTTFRTIYITGNDGQVSLAQSLMWELIGQQTHTYKLNEGTNISTATWNPNTAFKNPGRFDTIEVEGHISIPSHAAGAVMGKGGVSIKSIGDLNGVVIAMNSKEDAEATRERAIVITGTVSGCMGASSMVIAKMAEEEDGYRYVVNGTAYSRQHQNNGDGNHRDGGREYDRESYRGGDNQSHRGDRDRDRGDHNRQNNSFLNMGRNVRDYSENNNYHRDFFRNNNNNNNGYDNGSYAYGGRGRAYSRDDDDRHSYAGQGRQVTSTGDYRHALKSGGGGGGSVNHNQPSALSQQAADYNLGGTGSFEGIAETLSANTVIELAVPDTLIGAILGPQGATLNEIVNLSGAKIVVSKRNEKLEGTNNRVVHITGPPASAQTAHTLVVHKLRQFSSELSEQD